MADINKFHSVLNYADKRVKQKKSLKSKKRKYTSHSQESSSESSSIASSSDSESRSDSTMPDKVECHTSKRKGKPSRSGIFDRQGHSRIVKNQIFIHAALDNKFGVNKDLHSLSFNLLVVGESEIISDPRPRGKRGKPI